MKRFQPVNLSLAIIAVGMLLLPAACSPKIDNNGYVSEVPIKDQVVIGQTTKDQVKDKLGSPSSLSTYGDETWYYITDHKEAYLFFSPTIVTQNVTSITFDNAGVVSKIATYDKKDGEDFALATRTTPTEGHTIGFFESILGNIGRFNQPGNSGSGPSHNPGGGS